MIKAGFNSTGSCQEGILDILGHELPFVSVEAIISISFWGRDSMKILKCCKRASQGANLIFAIVAAAAVSKYPLEKESVATF